MGSRVANESDVDSKYGEQVLICLRRIMQAISLHSRSLVKQVGLTGPQLIFLKTLENAGKASAGDITKAISLFDSGRLPHQPVRPSGQAALDDSADENGMARCSPGHLVFNF